MSRSWLFEDSLRFAELTTVPLSPGNATHVSDLARRLLHFSPEPRVVRLLIESLVMQGREDEAAAQLARMRAAFPQAYNDFVGGSAALPPAPAPQTSPR